MPKNVYFLEKATIKIAAKRLGFVLPEPCEPPVDPPPVLLPETDQGHPSPSPEMKLDFLLRQIFQNIDDFKVLCIMYDVMICCD